MVSVDIYLNETTRHANVILPAPSPLERSDYALAFYGLAVRNFADWSPPLLEPDGPMEHEVLARLALIARSGQGAGADPAAIDEMMIAGVARSGPSRRPTRPSPIAPSRSSPPSSAATSAVDQIVDAMIRTGPYGDWFGAVPDGLSLAKLEANPHGIDLGPLQPRLPGALQDRRAARSSWRRRC